MIEWGVFLVMVVGVVIVLIWIIIGLVDFIGIYEMISGFFLSMIVGIIGSLIIKCFVKVFYCLFGVMEKLLKCKK